MRPPAKIHYLPPNDKVWTPPTVFYLTSATLVIEGSDPEVLALQSWHLRRVDRYGDGTTELVDQDWDGETGTELAGVLTEAFVGRTTGWLYTHNLGLDITTTRLPLALVAAGWTLGDASVSGSAPWLRMSKGSKRLTIVDAHSWLPNSLDDLAERMALPIPKRGKRSTAYQWGEVWAEFELGTLAVAMNQLMDWWGRERLGRWTVSGPGCGWNAMRHIRPVQRPVIDPDPLGIASDRKAIHGGRRGAWIVGTRSQGPFLELDFLNAYPAVAANLPLPTQRTKPFTHMALDNWRLDSERWGVIAECVLNTDTGRWPVRVPGGTFCPTGRFAAILAGPEIRDARRLGCLESVGAGYTHQLSYHLQNWARWVLETANAPGHDVPPMARVAAKNWSRSVIGKWASRGYEKTELGPSPVSDWGYEESWDHESQTRGAMVDLAGSRWLTYPSGDADQAYPAVLAWVESETRVRLSRVIEAVGEGCVLQCDTDGLIVNQRLLGDRAAGGWLWTADMPAGPGRTKWVLDRIDPATAPLTLRIKAKHRTVRVLGPQHVATPSARSFAGLPAIATEGAQDVYTYKQWPKLASQMGAGEKRGYVRPEAVVTVAGPYAPGWITTMGTVIPPECHISDDGVTRILPWHAMTRKPRSARLSEVQHPVLAALW